jgi:adenylosuccinate synthase
VRLGVVRTYTTRHGAGPLVTESATLTAMLLDAHNGAGPWQGAFRVGHFDAVAHRYAIEVAGGIDAVAVTHADVPAAQFCNAYAIGDSVLHRLRPGDRGDLDYQATLTRTIGAARPILDTTALDWPAHIGDLLGRPVAVVSAGPSAADKRERGWPISACRLATCVDTVPYAIPEPTATVRPDV